MALLATATTEGNRNLTASSTKSMFEILGTTGTNAKLVEFGISFNGVTSTDAPIMVELYQITATGTGTTVTPRAVQRTGGTPVCTTKALDTVEPTKTNRMAVWYVHPQGGNLVIQYPLGREPVISDASASQGLAWVLTPGTLTATTGCVMYLFWEE